MLVWYVAEDIFICSVCVLARWFHRCVAVLAEESWNLRL